MSSVWQLNSYETESIEMIEYESRSQTTSAQQHINKVLAKQIN